MITRDHVLELWDYLQAGQVTRFHTLPNAPRQTTAEHAGRVALIAWVLSGKQCRSAVLAACLVHDLPEALTGDVPAPAKWASLSLKEGLAELESRLNDPWPVLQVMDDLTEGERDLLALADAIDAVFFCVQGIRNGCLELINPYNKYMSYLRQRWATVDPAVWDWFRLATSTPKTVWNPWSHLDNG